MRSILIWPPPGAAEFNCFHFALQSKTLSTEHRGYGLARHRSCHAACAARELPHTLCPKVSASPPRPCLTCCPRRFACRGACSDVSRQPRVTCCIPSIARRVDFATPAGEAALASPHSVSWRVFKNPIALFVGGVAAVILELAEPAVRSGVWDHSSFRSDPLSRLRRTGLAAMITVYGPRSLAEPMIARVVQKHSRVVGHTAGGELYAANDATLLTWVHATAAYGFARAYGRYVEPLSAHEMDAVYLEGAPAARLYGAPDPPTSLRAVEALFSFMRGRLERSDIIFRFLDIMRETPTLPAPVAWMQPLLVRAAVDIIPDWIRDRLGLGEEHGLRRLDGWVVGAAAAFANRIVLRDSPAAQSCLRLGLPIDHLYG